MLASASSGPKGITAQAASAGMIVIAGAMMYSTLFAWLGRMISLNISLKASAIGCSSPQGPTRFGPRRMCMKPIILRSQYVRYATHSSSGSTTRTIFTRFHTTGHPPPRSDWPVVVICSSS